ncbi:MAG: apolipoprotein N-acyltransferase [Sphingomonadaceae bacterium]|nr:apolipoprotein N-acyltransferase [Sphingomonadaceae bacterium]
MLSHRIAAPSALLLGAISATGFAPLGWWPLTILALAAFLHLLSQAPKTSKALWLGWLFGLGYFIVGLAWIAQAFTYQAKMPSWLGWMAVPLLSLYLAVYPALAATSAHALARRMRSRHYLTLTMFFAATWIISEWLRSWVFTGFAWNPLAAVAPWAAAPTRFIGTYGMSGLLILLAGSVWLFFVGSRKSAISMVATLVLLWGTATISLTTAKPATNRQTAINVTIVQPNIDQGDKWNMAQRRANFAKLAANSPRLDARPRLLLWPEAAVPDYVEGGYPPYWYDEPPAFVRARLAAQLGPGDLLLTGAVKLIPNVAGNDVVGARNAVFALNDQGQLVTRYDKSHLVPYGEYLPMRPILSRIGLSRLAPGDIDFWPGPGARTLNLGPFGRAGLQICYEIIFSGQVVDRNTRPDFIFNPSNDAWFGAWGPPQHLAQARLRAVEEGLPVLRATPTGISAIIASDGRILHALPMHQAGRIDAAVPPALAPTFFARFGNILPLAFAIFLMVGAIVFSRKQR